MRQERRGIREIRRLACYVGSKDKRYKREREIREVSTMKGIVLLVV